MFEHSLPTLVTPRDTFFDRRALLRGLVARRREWGRTFLRTIIASKYVHHAYGRRSSQRKHLPPRFHVLILTKAFKCLAWPCITISCAAMPSLKLLPLFRASHVQYGSNVVYGRVLLLPSSRSSRLLEYIDIQFIHMLAI
eukprot:6181520-Pleurochrysis_carterae.AAC.3